MTNLDKAREIINNSEGDILWSMCPQVSPFNFKVKCNYNTCEECWLDQFNGLKEG